MFCVTQWFPERCVERDDPCRREIAKYELSNVKFELKRVCCPDTELHTSCASCQQLLKPLTSSAQGLRRLPSIMQDPAAGHAPPPRSASAALHWLAVRWCSTYSYELAMLQLCTECPPVISVPHSETCTGVGCRNPIPMEIPHFHR